jgi:hypothetical protein
VDTPTLFLISRQKLSLDDDGVVVFSLDGLISFVGDRRVRSNHNILQSPLVPSPSCCVYPVHVKPVSSVCTIILMPCDCDSCS